MSRIDKEKKFDVLYGSLLGERNLIVGCGTGNEIRNLAQNFPLLNFVGIDLEIGSEESGPNWNKIKMDAHALKFAPESFNFIYCYHVLEHVREPERVLEQINFVLKSDGKAFIGTPNKHRLFGYFSSDASFADKLRWNYADWVKRLSCKFENKYGAHAGFTHKEMNLLLKSQFSIVNNVTLKYYKNLYSGYGTLLLFLEKMGLLKFLVPSIYYISVK